MASDGPAVLPAASAAPAAAPAAAAGSEKGPAPSAAAGATPRPPPAPPPPLRAASGSEAPSRTLQAVYQTLNVGAGHHTPVKDRRLLRQVFERYDRDKNGELDETELRELLHDVYVLGIDQAATDGASKKWCARAKAQLATEWGKSVVSDAASELLQLRDLNSNGMLSWEEFSAALDSEQQRRQVRGRFWRLAPLADIPIDMDRLTNGPHFKVKVFVAGAAAGTIAKTVASPLARITILLQTGGIPGAAKDPVGLARHIYQHEGARGLFRGNTADILRQVPYAGTQFLTYEALKERISPYDTTSSKVGTRMFCGGIAGGVSIFATYPLDLVRARLCVQTQGTDRYRGIWHGLQRVRREEGIRGMYRGCGTAVCERFPNMAINFATYDITKLAMVRTGYDGLAPSILCGCIAGWVSTVATFPADVVMRNLQVSGSRGEHFSGPLACAKSIYAAKGAGGFYQGLLMQLAKGLPYCTATWVAYDLMRRLLHFEIK
eukprot:TRINITY_DN12248_c6_g1_i1.p1 TRINITY_DN12248_c6_g1~~TRINITY_DN12248_c6_g1_i1.p1  ORF type:complete len:507 (+),score=124.50 TRINITY_DN12248_c6_g1_i1:46-1521(+)